MRKETPRFVAAVAIIILCAHSHQSGYAAAPFFAGLGFLPGGSSGGASAVSADGSIVVGSANSSNSSPGYGEAFRWTQSAGMVGLGDRPGGSFISNAWGVSGDGSVVAGEGTYGNYFAGEHEAFRWTQATGMVGLGDLAGGSFTSTAYGISADGSTIVGQGTSATRQEAFRWTQG